MNFQWCHCHDSAWQLITVWSVTPTPPSTRTLFPRSTIVPKKNLRSLLFHPLCPSINPSTHTSYFLSSNLGSLKVKIEKWCTTAKRFAMSTWMDPENVQKLRTGESVFYAFLTVNISLRKNGNFKENKVLIAPLLKYSWLYTIWRRRQLN